MLYRHVDEQHCTKALPKNIAQEIAQQHCSRKECYIGIFFRNMWYSQCISILPCDIVYIWILCTNKKILHTLSYRNIVKQSCRKPSIMILSGQRTVHNYTLQGISSSRSIQTYCKQNLLGILCSRVLYNYMRLVYEDMDYDVLQKYDEAGLLRSLVRQ